MVTPLDDDPLLRELPEVDGYRVLGPCVLFDRLGAGAMGTVYHGRHLNLDIDVAVKCLNRSLALAGQSFVSRFQREARLAASVHHQNLIQVYDVSHAGELHYLVMEFVRGETARERVTRKGRLSEAEACRIVLGAASGLAQAHTRRIVHRDIKPDNILISRDGEVKVSDLGLAKALESQEVLTVSHAVMGTPQFMAPEQWNDSTTVGPAADVWSLGITLYFLLTGSHAFASGSMNEICKRICVDPLPDVRARLPSISDDVRQVLERCVARDLTQRYADARTLETELRRCLESDTTVLIDPEAGAARANDTLITPPPLETLTRIRTSFEAPRSPTPAPKPASKLASAPQVAAAPIAPPKPESVATPEHSSRAWMVLAGIAFGAIVLGGGGYALVHSLGREQPSSAAPSTSAKAELDGKSPVESPHSIDATAVPSDAPHQSDPKEVPRVSDEGARPAAITPVVEPAHETELAPKPAVDEHAIVPPPAVHEDPPQPPPKPEELPVELALDAALRAKPVLYTNASQFVVRGTVKQGSVDELELAIDGQRAQTIAVRDRRFETRVPLDSDRQFALTLTCARLAQPLALTIVRDTVKPSLSASLPAADSTFTRAATLDIELTFDESVDHVYFEGVSMTVADTIARRQMTAPQLKGPWRPQWTAWDRAGNQINGALSFKVR
jgi:serine/threonine protein kinase